MLDAVQDAIDENSNALTRGTMDLLERFKRKSFNEDIDTSPSEKAFIITTYIACGLN